MVSDSWWSEPPAASDVVAELRAVAADVKSLTGEEVTLLPGLTDAEMDAWLTPVPEDVRAFFRHIGGVQLGSGWDFDPGDPLNDDPDPDNAFRTGEPGTFRIMHTNGAAETYYVDVDPQTGAWGAVFSFWESHYACLNAPSLMHWFMEIADYVRRSARQVRAGVFEDLDTAFTGWFFAEFVEMNKEVDDAEASAVRERLIKPDTAAVLTATAARGGPDPLLAEIGRLLPDGACLADLRNTTRVTGVPFDDHPDWGGDDAEYRRFHQGKVLAGIPWE